MAGGVERRLVAVMFTDMVGYTALMQADELVAVAKRDLYAGALERHHRLCGGTIVQRLGDGSLSTFPSSLAAVRAAVGIQRELIPASVPLRIGIHVGEVFVEPERLTGDAVNVASRVESFAVAGSVFLSDAAYGQIKNRTDVEVVPLGPFRLKNVGLPLELYAIGGGELVVPDRADLEGKGERLVALRTTLPERSTSLLGRHSDLTAITGLLREHRVVTISGPGGVGKTRLAIDLGRALASEFLDGVAFVSFAEVADVAAFLPTLAAALDVKEAEERSFFDGIVALIGDRRALIVLDNLEQILAAAPDISALSEHCPELRLLTTSRAPLRIDAERVHELDPLETSSAVALFVERAQRAGSFELTPETTDEVAMICARLDGLPLALELAAARVRLLGASALLVRLDHMLDVLTVGRRDSPERQQTLRATIDWSHALLDPSEQKVFRRLAVFAGGCTTADAEVVTGAHLDELDSLVDKALVQADADGRLRMLQTIGEYARERLDESGEAKEVAAQHAHRYAVVAREIRDAVEGTDEQVAVHRGVFEEENLQVALATLLARARSEEADARERGMQMCGDLWMYWHIRGKNLTARDCAAAFLATDKTATPTLGRTGALVTAGLASWVSGQFDRADREWTEAHQIAVHLSADREVCVAGLARALGLMGLDPLEGLEWAKASVDRSRNIRFPWAEAIGSTFEAMLQAILGEPEAAGRKFVHALDIQERLGDYEGAGLSLGGLAQLADRRGELAETIELYERSLEAFQAIGDRAEEARILSEVAWAHLRHGDAPLARRYFLDSAQRYTDVASVRGVGLSLIGLAATAAAEDQHGLAVQLAAAAEVYAQDEGIVNVYSDDAPGREYVEASRERLSQEELAREVEVGRRLTIKEALERARPVVAAST